jgi:predicted NBD/HSP70 family sugar kinase
MPVLLTNRHIGDVNRSRVLRAFCDHGPLSRADLARLAGVPRATIGAIIQGLLDDGLLEESEPDRASGRVGKPARPLWFRREAPLSAAVAFGSSSVEAALVNARGEVLRRHDVPMDPATVKAPQLSDAVLRALAPVIPADAEGVLGIGVAVPGVCDTTTATVVGSSQLPGATGRGLADALQRAYGLPVLVDNDARAQALGEKWFGEGRGVASFAAVQTGRGLGVGLVLDGVLFRGADGMTGELGHTCVDPTGEICLCGLRGCWETVATLRWLRAEGARRDVPDAGRLDAGRLVATSSNAAAAQLLEDYADHLALGLANLVHLLNPSRLLLHGDAVLGGETFRVVVEERVRARCLPHLRDNVEVLLSSLDRDAGLLGAAGLVLSETFALAA